MTVDRHNRDNVRIQGMRDTSTNLTRLNPVLVAGEMCMETDTGRFKIGNGTTAWNDLLYSGGLTSETWTMVLDDENETEITKEVAIWSFNTVATEQEETTSEDSGDEPEEDGGA